MLELRVVIASRSLAQLLREPSWSGCIGAVFERGVQVLGPDGALLHVQGGALLASPFGLRVAGCLAPVIQASGLKAGTPATKRGPRLTLGDGLALSLEAAQAYASPPPARRPLDPAAVSLARRLLRQPAGAAGFCAVPGATIEALCEAVAARAAVPLLDVSRQLIGLGPGSTPAGDDVLVGCLKGLWLLAGRDRRLMALLTQLHTALPAELDRLTTRLSAAFIRHALDGQFAQVLDEAAHALISPTTAAAVSAALRRLLAQGETSGRDTALGLLTCLEALQRQPGRAAGGRH
jgi:hypothetical protein